MHPSRLRKLLSTLIAGAALSALTTVAVAMPSAVTSPLQPIRIVSTPNPSVLPLLLAMARDPNLPVQLMPVGSGAGINDAFASQGAEGLLAMTWVAASEVTNGVVPDLKLVTVNFWRGFFELTPSANHIANLSDLTGKNLLLSGPVGSGRDSGPDILFKAMMKREGYDPSTYSENTVTINVGGSSLSVIRRVYPSGDFRVYYMPAMAAAKVLISQTVLDDGDGVTSNDQPASGSFMVDPAATGIVMNGTMQGLSLTKSIDVQQEFSGYRAWPANELPLGGLSLRASVLNDPSRAAEVQQVRMAYEKAASDLMAARGHPLVMLGLASAISQGITTYYQQYGLSLPAPVIAAAIRNGDLVYRTDTTVDSLMPDLVDFDTELLGSKPPESFYLPR